MTQVQCGIFLSYKCGTKHRRIERIYKCERKIGEDIAAFEAYRVENFTSSVIVSPNYLSKIFLEVTFKPRVILQHRGPFYCRTLNLYTVASNFPIKRLIYDCIQ